MSDNGSPVRIKSETRSRIEAAKVHPRETIDDVLNRLLGVAEAWQELMTEGKLPDEDAQGRAEPREVRAP